jgi:hypothetical protein
MSRRKIPKNSNNSGLAINPSLKIQNIPKTMHKISPKTTAIGINTAVDRIFLDGNMIVNITIKDKDVRLVMTPNANQS